MNVESKVVCCVWLCVLYNYIRSLVLSCGNIVLVLFRWNMIKILQPCVNEVSRFVLCAWELLERDGWLRVMRTQQWRTRNVHRRTFLLLYVVTRVTSARE